MPTYELVTLIKPLAVPAVKDALKRAAQYIFEVGGVIRNLEHLGKRNIAYKMTSYDGNIFKEAFYFIYVLDTTESKLKPLGEKLENDQDIIRKRIYFLEDKLNLEEKIKPECTIHKDLLDVPFRPHVQQIISMSKKSKKKPFVYGGNRTFDPFV